jgi:glycosyltransferase involved in cell wall biosynthesis
MRVLYSFPHPIGGPGIGTTALNQVKGLVERGLDVTLCCTSVALPTEPGLPEDILETLVVAGKRIPHRVVGFDRALRYHDHRTARLIHDRSDVYDIVHAWPLASTATLGAANDHGIAGLRESPNCYTAVAYERVAREAARLGLTVPRRASHHFNAARLKTEEHEYDLATAILAPSDAVEDSYNARAGGPPDILRHRYGFAPNRFPRPPDSRRDRSPFVLTFVGSCEPRKGVHYALEAWRRSGLADNGGRFVIVGRWEKYYRELLDDELNSRGIELREFTDDVGEVLRSADCLILPSIEEGSALITYEAQASGCVLLVSEAAGALMTDGVHGFVHPVGDVAELADQLARLAGDPDLLAEMRTAVIGHRDELSWSAAAIRLEAVYHEALPGN